MKILSKEEHKRLLADLEYYKGKCVRLEERQAELQQQLLEVALVLNPKLAPAAPVAVISTDKKPVNPAEAKRVNDLLNGGTKWNKWKHKREKQLLDAAIADGFNPADPFAPKPVTPTETEAPI